MLNASEWNTLIPIIVAIASPYLAKLGISDTQASTLLGAAGSFAAAAYMVYSAWNMKRVHETAIVSGHAPDKATADAASVTDPGGRPNGANRGGLMSLFLLGGILVASLAMLHEVRSDPIKLAKNQTPAEFNAGTPVAPGTTTQANAAGALTSVLGDLANYVDSDLDEAIKLSTAIPDLQDGHGQGCWLALKDFSAVVKLHPLPATLKLASDLQAFRLDAAAINKVCANPHCNMVFTDLANGIAQIGAGIPVPALTAVCAKVPTITMVAPASPSTGN